MEYRKIKGSVLEDQWITDILGIQNQHILFLAEGLFMYLPQKQVEGLFKKLSELFSKSAFVFETVNKKYTQGLWKKSVESKMKRSAGTTAGASYQFGLYSDTLCPCRLGILLDNHTASVTVFLSSQYHPLQDLRVA